MNQPSHRILVAAVGGVLTLFTAGCLGPKVLKERTQHFPATDPRVELQFKTTPPADVLVLYDEHRQRSDQVTRKAFYLFANERRLSKGKRPAFVSPATQERMVSIPILKGPPVGLATNHSDLYAFSPQPQVFELRSRDRTLAEFRLPEYGQWLTAKKFFLFPLAATADAVGVGAALGAAAAVGAAESGASFSFP